VRDFSFKPTLTGQLVRLRPFRDNDVDVMHGAVADAETNRLTGTHAEFTEAQIREH